jgi:hypothetical protein
MLKKLADTFLLRRIRFAGPGPNLFSEVGSGSGPKLDRIIPHKIGTYGTDLRHDTYQGASA